jgi:cytokinin dehydrogenase
MDRPGGPPHAGWMVRSGRAGATTPPPLDGELRFDEQARAAAADDFGHIVHRPPEGVLWPGSDRDVAAVIRWAAGSGRTVGPRGRGNSVFGRSQVQSGIVIDMSQLRTVGRVQDDRVVVDAGASWADVLDATLPHGLTPPVLSEYLGLSIGGTLVVGGVGATTSRHGVQGDNVLEIEIVTGNGQQLRCSATTNADLFDAVRAGLGQVGVIVRATLALVPAPERVRRYQVSYPDLPTMLADERRLAADSRFDAVQGAIMPKPQGWTYRLDAVKYLCGPVPDDDVLLAGLSDERSAAQLSTLPYRDYACRLAALEQALRANGQWSLPHPWLTTFVGDSQVDTVVDAELADMTPPDLGTFGQVVLSAFRRDAITSPLLRLPADEVFFAFNLVRIPTGDDAGEVDRLVAANRATYERVRAAGGTLYPASAALPMSPADWRAHFGPAFTSLSEAKQTHDPYHTLTAGYELWRTG